MAVSNNGSYSSATSLKILRLLENLNATSTGTTIYNHIQHSLQDLDSQYQERELCLHDQLKLLLETLISQLTEDSPHLVQALIIQKCLTPGMPSNELAPLKQQLSVLISDIRTTQLPEHNLTHHAFNPLIAEFGNSQNLTTPPASTEVTTETTSIKKHDAVVTEESEDSNTAQENDSAATVVEHDKSTVQNVDLVYRHKLDKTRDNIQTIHSNLGEQVSNAIQFNSELTDMLQTSIDAMRKTENPEDIKSAKDTYIRQCNSLISSQQDLVTKFDSIHVGLNDIQSNSQDLDDELTRIHLLSLTDELTELPNRRALMQRMDDEVIRVQRYGYPLALAIIDLDEFKPINDRFGHAAGDNVLKHFSKNIFSVFRHHDTIARYGGEEFAVLMPNTEIEGALCALRKVQCKLEEAPCHLESGIEIASPTFSAGIALYNPGETTDELIKRADMAMYRAKRMGRNRIEVHTMGTKQTSQTASP